MKTVEKSFEENKITLTTRYKSHPTIQNKNLDTIFLVLYGFLEWLEKDRSKEKYNDGDIIFYVDVYGEKRPVKL